MISRPAAVTDSRPASMLGRRLLVALVVLTVVRTPGLVGSLVMVAVVVVVIGWCLSRIGLGWLLMLMRPPARRPRPDRAVHALSFRVDDGIRPTEVVVAGHRSGVHLGDHLRVFGPRLGGAVRAVVVRNSTTGAVLVRRGLGRAVVLAGLAMLVLAGLLGGGRP